MVGDEDDGEAVVVHEVDGRRWWRTRMTDEEERLRWDNDWSLDTSGVQEYTRGNSLPVNGFNATPLSANSHVLSERPELPATIQLSLQEQLEAGSPVSFAPPPSEFTPLPAVQDPHVHQQHHQEFAPPPATTPSNPSFPQANMPPTSSPSRPSYENITPKPPQQFVP
ncbi:unnamed protein product [Heligmosomoides polygyrus]|uniref:SH3 domain-containing protein n=1 Tax=Heligmosomoides polygyrus TaxID=6339 RepID=A0A183FQA3_HELPZ|nr:unnamed protein product [Heligmosomoides polygyrus]